MKWATLAAAAPLLPGLPERGLVCLGRVCGEDDVIGFLQKQVIVHVEPAAGHGTGAQREADGYGLQMDRHAWLLFVIAVESLVLFVTIGLPILAWVVAAAIGRSIRFGVETYGQLFLGTDVTIGRLETDIFQGIITVESLQVQNPQTHKYESPYLLKAGLLKIDIDMVALVCSFFRHVKVEKLNFKNVDVIYEKGWNCSNVQDMLNLLRGNARDQQDVGKEGRDSPPSGAQVTLHEVIVEDVGARVQAQMLGGRGMRASVGDVTYGDFEAEVGESTVGPIIQVLLKSVLKTVVTNVAGKQIGEACM